MSPKYINVQMLGGKSILERCSWSWKSKLQSHWTQIFSLHLGFSEGEEMQTEPAEKSSGISEALSIWVGGNSPESTVRWMPKMSDATLSINSYLEMVQDALTKPFFNMKMTPYWKLPVAELFIWHMPLDTVGHWIQSLVITGNRCYITSFIYLLRSIILLIKVP